MRRSRRNFLALTSVLLLLGVLASVSCAAKDAPRMTKETLKEMIGSPDLVILDVRYGKDWDSSKDKIKGAFREDPKEKTKDWAGKYGKDKTIVLYCA